MIQQGEMAPEISAPDQDGKVFRLSALRGKKIALYFYPKDDTPTCTTQACNLRDNITLLKRKKITVIGVSIDTEKKHQKFRAKHELPFTLLADTDQKIVTDYGVWGEKNLYGRTYMGTHRTTFLIDEEGRIAHVIEKVVSADHAAQIVAVWGL
jgi:peroxiredoxin Q/BCP